MAVEPAPPAGTAAPANQLWVGAITIITPMVIALLKAWIPRIPKPLIPWLTPLVGAGIEWIAILSGSTDGNLILATLAGMAGVAVREAYHQLQLRLTEHLAGLASGGPLVIAIVVASAGAGCVSYRHTRADPGSGAPIETTVVRAPWLTKTTVEGLKSRTSEKRDKAGVTSYSRSIGLEAAKSETDVEGVKALESLLGSLLIRGLSVAGGGLPAVTLPTVAPASAPPSAPATVSTNVPSR